MIVEANQLAATLTCFPRHGVVTVLQDGLLGLMSTPNGFYQVLWLKVYFALFRPSFALFWYGR
jgi:hypothetical protein